MDIIPIFIVSLPRAGSTLLQRIMGATSEIYTVSEPWLLLPQIYSMKKSGAAAEYGHYNSYLALTDFVKHLPRGWDDYRETIRLNALTLYQKAAGDQAMYFLDKTPRYNLVVQELHDIFPEAKFIYLWRNPLAVVASILNTWGNGQWNVYKFYVDLYKGLDLLVNSYLKYQDTSIAVNYEDLIMRPVETLGKIGDYLGLDLPDADKVDLSENMLTGCMGDPTGTRKYSSISSASINKWVKTFNNIFRKRWALQYLDWMGCARLEAMGYNYSEIKSTLCSARISSQNQLIRDGMMMGYGRVYNLANLRLLKRNIANLKKYGVTFSFY